MMRITIEDGWRLTVNLRMRSPQAIMPSVMPVPAERMKDWVQPAGMTVTVDLTPAPKKLAPLDMWWAIGWLSGEKTVIGSELFLPGKTRKRPV